MRVRQVFLECMRSARPSQVNRCFIFLRGMHACLLRKARFNETRACAQLFRSLFSAVMCGALARAQKVPRLFGPLRLWPAYAVRGFPGAASMVFYYQAIAMLPLSDAVRSPFGSGKHERCCVLWAANSIAWSCCFARVFTRICGRFCSQQEVIDTLRCPCCHTKHLGGGHRLLLEPVADSRPALIGM